jgi:hypothetical protein
VTQETIDNNEHITNPFCYNHGSLSDTLDHEDNKLDQTKEGNVVELTINAELKEDEEQIKEESQVEINSERENSESYKKSVHEELDNQIDSNENNFLETKKETVVDYPFKSFKTKSNLEDSEDSLSCPKQIENTDEKLQLECQKFDNWQSIDDNAEHNSKEASIKKNGDEDLDSICELQSQNESENIDNNFNQNNSNLNHHSYTRDHHNLNVSVHSNHSQSRSRSHRRSKYQSMIAEEFPSDLVEGSIRTFNQSFSGLESIHKSDRFPSSTKLKEDN